MRGRRDPTPAARTLAAVDLDARLRAARNHCELLRAALDGEPAGRLDRLDRDLKAALDLLPEVLDAEIDAAYTAGLRAGWREAGRDVDALDADAHRLARDVFGEGPAW